MNNKSKLHIDWTTPDADQLGRRIEFVLKNEKKKFY